MTIPAGTIWCPDCEDVHHDASICDVCGATLIVPPAENTEQNRSVRVLPTITEALGSLQNSTADANVIQNSIVGLQNANRELQQTGAELRNVMSMLQQQITQVQEAQLLLQRTMNVGELDGRAGLFAAHQARSNATNATVLANLPRTTLTEQSQSLRQGRLVLKDGTSLDCTAACFGGMGTATGTPSITHRGNGKSFAEIARTAQESGFAACVVINNTSQPWPFCMTDSRKEASNISIPVLLLKHECGPALLASPEDTTITVQPLMEECCICTENFVAGNTQLKLPRCGHRFHEECALSWLRQHNSCPYCRDQVDRKEPHRKNTTVNHETFYG